MSWKQYGDIAFYLCAFTAIAFALLYLGLAPWWKTVTGRNIMTVMGSLAVALGYFSWVIYIGGVPAGFYPMRALIFTAIAAAIGWRIVIFIRHHIIWSLRIRERNDNEPENAREDAG
jgi:hypothetical protein